MSKEITHESWVGESLQAGRYRITAFLESSDSGLVFQAHDTHADAHLLLTVSHQPLSGDTLETPSCACPYHCARTNLTHPHILPLVEHGTHRQRPYWLFPGISQTLEQRRSCDVFGGYRPMEIASVAHWIKDIASALDFSHAHGCYYHRIHPDMILFDQAGKVYLPSFILTWLNRPRTTRPVYDAPELFESGEANSRTDQYSMALMVHELLAGRLLTPVSSSLSKILMNGLCTPITSLADLPLDTPKHVLQALRKAISCRPQDRFTTCEEFADLFLGNQ